jgi:TRAP-type C4-dicarboxylate transport system permease large subunit
MIPFLLFYAYSIFIAHFNGRNIAEDETNFYVYNTWLIVLTHTFLSRGVYKYYDAFINPFLVISLILLVNKFVNIIKSNSEIELDSRKKKTLNILSKILFPMIFFPSIALIYAINWGIMISSRFLHPVWLLFLFVLLSFLLPLQYYRELKMKKNYKQFWRDIKLILSIIWHKIKTISKNLWVKLRFRKKKTED